MGAPRKPRTSKVRKSAAATVASGKPMNGVTTAVESVPIDSAVIEPMTVEPSTNGSIAVDALSSESVSQPIISGSEAALPAFESIQRRAFEIFLERGATHGHDLSDWLAAEAELRGKFATAA